MNRIFTFRFIVVSLLLVSPIVYAMQDLEKKLETYDSLLQVVGSSDVVSPQIIKDLFEETRLLDEQIARLPNAQRSRMLERAYMVQNRYRAAFKEAVKRQLLGSFYLDQNRIYKVIGATATSATWAASLSLVYFSLQVGTGNLKEIDQTKLLVAGLEGVVAELVRQGFEQYNTRIGNLAASMSKDPIMSLTSAGSAMLVHKKTLITRPTTTGMLMAGLKTELFVVINEIIEKEGGISGILKKVNVHTALFGTELVPAEQQPLVATIHPMVRATLRNQKIQRALMQVLCVTTESALVGILLHYAGLGFAEETTVMSTLVGAAVRGLVEGSFSYMLNVSGGVVPATMGGMLGRSVEKGLIKQAGIEIVGADMVTIVVEKSVHTALQYTINESGGLGNFTKLALSKTAQAVNQKWLIPFKDFCIQSCDFVLDRIMGFQPATPTLYK